MRRRGGAGLRLPAYAPSHGRICCQTGITMFPKREHGAEWSLDKRAEAYTSIRRGTGKRFPISQFRAKQNEITRKIKLISIRQVFL